MKKRNNYIFQSVNTSKVESTKTNMNKGLSKEYRTYLSNKKRSKLRNKRIRNNIRSYKSYMQSKLWVTRKNQYWQEHGRQCVACGSKNYVTLHHAYYSGNWGSEPDSEVFAFCGGCHSSFHKSIKLKKDMRKETLQFIEDTRDMIYSRETH